MASLPENVPIAIEEDQNTMAFLEQRPDSFLQTPKPKRGLMASLYSLVSFYSQMESRFPYVFGIFFALICPVTSILTAMILQNFEKIGVNISSVLCFRGITSLFCIIAFAKATGHGLEFSAFKKSRYHFIIFMMGLIGTL
jgi:hypothetical protein